MSISVESIIEKYNSMKRKKEQPSNYYLFIIMENKNFLKDNSTKIKLRDRRIILRDKWNNLSFKEKSVYTEASIKLGYTPKIY